MSTPSRLLLLSALLAACASTPKPAPAPSLPPPASPVPEGPITLGFAWAEGLSAQVTYSTSRLRTGEEGESGESRYRMVVRGDGAALKVVSEDLQLAGAQEGTRTAAGPVSIPTVVVSRGGDFLRVEGADAVLAQVGALLEEQGQTGEQKERVLGLLRTAVVEGAKETWHVQVAAWRGVTLEPGKPVTRRARLSPATLANVEVPVTETLLYEGAVPCTEGEVEKRCVRLTFEARPVAEALPGVRAAFLGRVKALAGAQAPEVKLDELQVAHRTELVTEPGALIPHRVHTSRRTRVVFLSGEGQRNEDDQREEADYIYVYAGK